MSPYQPEVSQKQQPQKLDQSIKIFLGADYKLLSHNSIQEFELKHSTTKTVWALQKSLE
jgi:hypothetical protein